MWLGVVGEPMKDYGFFILDCGCRSWNFSKKGGGGGEVLIRTLGTYRACQKVMGAPIWGHILDISLGNSA